MLQILVQGCTIVCPNVSILGSVLMMPKNKGSLRLEASFLQVSQVRTIWKAWEVMVRTFEELLIWASGLDGDLLAWTLAYLLFSPLALLAPGMSPHLFWLPQESLANELLLKSDV